MNVSIIKTENRGRTIKVYKLFKIKKILDTLVVEMQK